jgi:hypothetical protein
MTAERCSGLLAQLGEHRPYKAGVTGSNPVQSTITFTLIIQRIVSSAGRAPPLQGGGHWFEPSTIHQSITASPRMVSSAGRASPLQGEGHWFDPSTIHHIFRLSSGLLAQLGEHRPYKAGVTGSNPVQSTKSQKFIKKNLSFVSRALPSLYSNTGITGSNPVQSTKSSNLQIFKSSNLQIFKKLSATINLCIFRQNSVFYFSTPTPIKTQLGDQLFRLNIVRKKPVLRCVCKSQQLSFS